MSLGCARCGECCQSIRIPGSPEKIAAAVEAGGASEDYVFIAAHWTPVRRARDATGYIYACRRYDAEHQTCGAWDDRPRVCRRFPWDYKDEGEQTPDEIAKGGSGPREPNCSYWLDVKPENRPARVGRPLIPITIIDRV